ncbi:hypothetical protein S7711_09936 [Stachybotrys chartarum IBT 7711]|uniref:Zn(2)-C6 fungal-type domain-containing protein n=1 Tax=Stachybotrys chartarum (strain CBS 109288 / IBT 7711) TaxID=1280523 RepID=A0A084AUV6_STACB|nr:hypothetical protein S7711_09936 [Stachybotrys chartarum IBT 7711]
MAGITPRLPRLDPNAQLMTDNAEPDSDPATATHEAGSRRKRARSHSNDPPAATVACDQCRLRKVRCDRRQPDCSNCRKSGIECSTTSTLRRVNHTKQLRDDISVVLDRLDNIDTTLAALTKIVHQLAAQPRCNHRLDESSSSSLAAGQSLLLSPKLDSNHQSDAAAPIHPFDNGMFDMVGSQEGGKRASGCPTSFVMFQDLVRQATGSIRDNDDQSEHRASGNSLGTMPVARTLQSPCVRATLRKRLDEFPSDSSDPEPVVTGDIISITASSRLMCDKFVKGYLKNFNTCVPIFNEAELHAAIEKHYDGEEVEENSTWTLIINNIVLLQLGLEIRVARASHANSGGMSDELLPSFLWNSDRAIQRLTTLIVPNLVNVQALMTLTLVAQHFYSDEVAQRVCQAACQAGRMLGLDRPRAQVKVSRDDFDETDAGRQRVFQVLYTMDKHRVFMTGLPCDLYVFDSGYRPFNNAFSRLANLWEDIYLKLYTPGTAIASEEARAEQVQRLSVSLDRYCQKYVKSIPTIPDDTEDFYPIKMELVYGFYISQILVLRCSRRNAKVQEKMRELSRTSLKLILALCELPVTTSRLALLANIVGSYPTVAFFELASFHLASLMKSGKVDVTAQADIALFQAFCRHLQILEHNKVARTFYTSFKLQLTWTLDILIFLVETLTSAPANKDRDNHHPPAPSTGSPKAVLPDIELPQILQGCPIRLPTVYQGDPALLSAQPTELSEFVMPGITERTDLHYFASMDMGFTNLDLS